MIPACAKSAARTPAWVGIALWMRFTEPPVLVYSIEPGRVAAGDRERIERLSGGSNPSSTAPAIAAPNGPTPTGG